MKICILGGSGFIGGHLLNQLSGSGIESLVPTRNPGARSEARVASDVIYRTTDIFDPAQLNESIEGCQVVINLVGILNESGRDGSGFERAHVGLVDSLIEACQANGIQRFIQLSSINAGTGDSHYLRTKGDAELRLRQSSLDWTIFRPSVVFGPGDSFLNTFACLLRLGRGFIPLACPDARMQPVYVGDVAAALKYALLHPTETTEQVYELAGPKVYSLAELVRYTRDQLQLPGAVIGLTDGLSKLQAAMLQWIPGKPFSPDNYRSLQFDSVSDKKGLEQLGITPTSLEAVVPRYLGRNNRSDRHQTSRRAAGRDAS